MKAISGSLLFLLLAAVAIWYLFLRKPPVEECDAAGCDPGGAPGNGDGDSTKDPNYVCTGSTDACGEQCCYNPVTGHSFCLIPQCAVPNPPGDEPGDGDVCIAIYPPPPGCQPRGGTERKPDVPYCPPGTHPQTVLELNPATGNVEHATYCIPDVAPGVPPDAGTIASEGDPLFTYNILQEAQGKGAFV